MVALFTIFCHLAENNQDLCTNVAYLIKETKYTNNLRIFFWSPRQLPTCYYVVTAIAIRARAELEGGEY